MDSLSDIRNAVTFWIAVAGFVISVYNFVSGIFRNTVRVKVEFSDTFHFAGIDECSDVIHLKITNLSQNPIVLSRLSVENALGKHAFGSYRKRLLDITSRTGSVVTGKERWVSDFLPFKIEGNGCANLLLVSDGDKQAIELQRDNIVRLYTSKRTIRRKLNINAFSDPELLSQCRGPN